MRSLVSCEERLKTMIVLDKQEMPQKINKVIKSEILFLLKNYFELTSEDVCVDIGVNESGKYDIEIRAESRNIKSLHVFGD